MANDEYERVALDENDADATAEGTGRKEQYCVKYTLLDQLSIFVPVIAIFTIGFVAGGAWMGIQQHSMKTTLTTTNGLLNPQSFVPESTSYMGKLTKRG